MNVQNQISLPGRFILSNRTEERPINVAKLFIAGWTGRDPVALHAHIQELSELGVVPPSKTPLFYQLGPNLLTTGMGIEAIGTRSSGEAEAVIVTEGGHWWVTVGSDHTDRQLETVSVTRSKQVCRKPIAGVFWDYAEVAAHWDDLELRSYIWSGAQRTLYQHGTLGNNLHPTELFKELLLTAAIDDEDRAVALFCGTQPVHGAIRGSGRFEIELQDPILKRRIAHTYDITSLPDLG